jgi:integrase/recombinase XerC
VDNNQLIKEFQQDLERNFKYSTHTITAYKKDIQVFLTFINKKKLNILQANERDIAGFVIYLHSQKLQAVSIARFLASVRACYRFLMQQNYCNQNPAKYISGPKIGQTLPKTLSQDDTKNLLEKYSHKTQMVELRDIAMAELFYSSGLRLEELQSLNRKDLDLSNDLVKVFGKGRKFRIVPVGSKAKEALEMYLSERLDFKEDLFLSVKTGRRLTMRAVEKAISRMSQQVLGYHVFPHQLRHSFASHMLTESRDLKAVQELLGHKHLKTTQIYTKVDMNYLNQVYKDFHPKAKKQEG